MINIVFQDNNRLSLSGEVIAYYGQKLYDVLLDVVKNSGRELSDKCFVIDMSQVESFDLACAQVLISFKKSYAGKVRIDKCSPSVIDVLEKTGLKTYFLTS